MYVVHIYIYIYFEKNVLHISFYQYILCTLHFNSCKSSSTSSFWGNISLNDACPLSPSNSFFSTALSPQSLKTLHHHYPPSPFLSLPQLKNMAMSMSMAMPFSPPLPPSRIPTSRIRAKPANGYPPESPIVDRAAANGARSPQIGKKAPANGAHIPQIGKNAAALDEGLGLSALFDDGYGAASIHDYYEAAGDIIEHDGGSSPRWFCPVECGRPIKDAPLLLFLPGADGIGMGLILHHKSLGKVFEVRCLHIPVNDRTPFEGLLKFVEDILKYEHSMYPNKPIYLVGDSFGGCLALALAAHNPSIDLVLVLVNPATSFDKSQVQLLLPALEALPSELYTAVPYLLRLIMGDPVKMALTTVGDGLPLQQTLDELSKSLVSLLPRPSDLTGIISKETLLWKLKLLKSAASYVNSRLHAVEAEVLLLASGKDNLLPSGAEAERLHASLKKTRICYFKDNGHTLLLEDGINLLTVIKGTGFYRRSSKYDFVEDYLPPSKAEFIRTFEQDDKWFQLLTSPVMLSTLRNGRIVRGLAGVPDNGPVLLVGYHMLMGMELNPLCEAFLREKKIIIRGLAHPTLFAGKSKKLKEFSRFDLLTLFGGLPVSAKDMYRLFSRKSFVLLYPGGAREALHRKGEEYKLFWPDQPEFVRMAAKFEVTIVPFGVVGEDDIAELVVDYDDLNSNPLTRRFMEELNQDGTSLRADAGGEVANQQFLYIPGVLPKLPGRFYYLFGKPIETQGMKGILKDRKNANDLYLQIKSEVEDIISYLKRKREEDPYRGILQRALYQNSRGSTPEVPTFDP